MIGTAADDDQDRTATVANPPQDDVGLDPQAPPSMRVVEAIARATGGDPAEMAPLYGSVDPDALDRLFERGVDVRFRFEYQGRLVEVHGDGTILVDGERFGVR